MRVTSTVPDYLRLLDLPAADRERGWREQYEAAHPDIFATYYSAWGRASRRAEAAGQVDELAQLVVEREERAKATLQRTADAFVGLGLLAEPEFPVVLMVGQRSSNGWVTEFQGEQTLFLALEFLGEPPYDDVLISHESLHVAHLLAGAADWAETIAAGLFTEGLAVALSRHLSPGLADTAYLWFDGEHEGWLRDCAAAADEIRARLRPLLDSVNEDDTRMFFSRPPDGETLPMRCGYWAGDVLVTAMLDEGTTPHELLTMGYDDVRRAIETGLSDVAP